MTRPVLFVDSNVLIESLFLPGSAAAVIAELTALRRFEFFTCRICVDDVEEVIMSKLKVKPRSLDLAINEWEKLKHDTRLIVLEDPSTHHVEITRANYLPLMRHMADIPVLAAALQMHPKPRCILSGNRKHFNDSVASKCGIDIFSCTEFIELLVTA